MVKKILLWLGVLIILFTSVNAAGALSSSFLDAIDGLPLSDQILIIAKEVDRLKLKDELRDACYLADELLHHPKWHTSTVSELIEDTKEAIAAAEAELAKAYLETEVRKYFERFLSDNQAKLAELQARYDEYLPAKEECDRLTEEYNQKYGK